MAYTKEEGEEVKSPSVVNKENDEQRQGLQRHTNHPDDFAAHAVRYNGNRAPCEDAGDLLSSQDPGSHPKRKATVYGYGHQQHVDNIVAHTAPEVDADEVPEGAGALSLLEEHPGPNLSQFVLLWPVDRLTFRSA